MVGGWIAEHDLEVVMAEFEKAQAAVAPIYDVEQIFDDPQFRALGTLAEVPDEDLGRVTMQNVLFRLSETPGEIRWAGRRLGQDNAEVYRELLDVSAAELDRLKQEGVV